MYILISMDNIFTNNLIYENRFSLPCKLCNIIIKLFEEQTEKQFPGNTFSGVNKNIKDTTDLLVPKNSTKEEDVVWKKIEKTLYSELYENIKLYINNLTIPNIPYKVLGSTNMHIDFFMVQKYKKQSGKYIYHNDFCAESNKNRYRVVTFIWYLNTLEEGGQTEFFGNHLIKPEQGKLLLFPASWTFPHCGKVPISNDKYIITGWFYTNN